MKKRGARWVSSACRRVEEPKLRPHSTRPPRDIHPHSQNSLLLLLPSFLFLLDRVPKLLGSFCFSLCRYPLTQQHNCVCASTHFLSPFFLFTSPVIHRSDQANGGGDSAAARRRNARRSQFPPLLFYFTFLFIFFFSYCVTLPTISSTWPLISHFTFQSSFYSRGEKFFDFFCKKMI